ncbi:MAG: hypothetical protein KJ050_08845 [Candidatus Omnitrophica bacterium]|nr:hypothetical protein [Candidatus Omnitrophota bacterium]
MLVENLIPHGFVAQLHCPPQATPERALKELYLILSGRFRYPQFELLHAGQGAVLKEGEQRSCEIYPDHLVIKEQPTQLNFDEFLEQVVPIVQEVRNHIGQPIWIFQQSILRYLLPFDTPVMPMLQQHFFKIGDSDLDKFKRPVLGLCARIEFPPLPEEPTQVQLRIEPYFREPKMLFLELSSRYLQPIQQISEFEQRLRGSYEFLKDRACGFLRGIFSRNQEF